MSTRNKLLAGSFIGAAFSMMLVGASLAADTTIKLGNTAPYSGPASAYGTIARAEAAYFQMLNDQGGINGRKIDFLSLDDAYSPSKTVEQTRRLVEQDEVLAVFSSVGTAPNISVQKYLNIKHVPQIFVSSGATRWNDPKQFPWTVGFNPTYELEGKLYAQYVLKTKPDAKIAVIIPDEDAGKDYLRGFKEGLGEHVDQLVSSTTYLTSDPTIDSQMVTMRESGADVFFAEATPKFAAQAIKKAGSMGWKPLIILPSVSNSVSAVLEPAGIENTVGVVTGLYLKDPNDARWADDPGVKDFLAWMKKYQPNASTGDLFNVQGYTVAQVMEAVLRNCKDDLSRENIIKQSTTLKALALPLLLPGITVHNDPSDVTAIHQIQMARFDGKSWVLFGDVLGDK
ncbi:ABC transporter substrate-binding protein [Bradyrhizobium canariense]|uniref:Branched-chain amino acid transport system substrate-binding protein n=1 Tax=Bradyrhizobium canariense TaxID=255045 RepID=A0A1H2AN28_9BRAD|nr:ABC transporter substrate-binding protein [Bradyrhizobium canariense]SDT47321.1 branched-chain amino acid transport system substrate-binding protein [Bradyrhizobium canariense]